MKRLLIILCIIFIGLLCNNASAQTDQAVKNGTYTTTVNFSTGCTYTWVNDAPSIGLPAKGTGNIIPFIAQNDGEHDITANITAKSITGCPIIKFKIVVSPTIPTVTVAGAAVNVNSVYGDVSQAAKFTVSGANLRSGVLVKAPSGFEVSTDGTNFHESVSLNSDNAQLSYINFNPDIVRTTTTGAGDYNYYANVDNSVSSITVSPVTSAALSRVKINDVSVDNGAVSAAIPLIPGSNTISIVVTAPNAINTKTYIINITRAGSSDATLSGLSDNQGSIAPAFSSAKTDYTTNIYTNFIKITPTTTNSGASVKVNGVDLRSGTESADIAIAYGLNAIPITVTAQDGVTTKTYTLNVISTKAANAGLSQLSLKPNIPLTRITGTTNYYTSIESTENSVQQLAVASDANAAIKVNGIPVVSGVLSNPIPLNTTGNTTITTVVTAQDGTTTQVYSVTIGKSYSTNTSLASAYFSPLVYLTAEPNTNNYNTSVNRALTSVRVSATPSDDKATVKINNVSVANSTLSDAIPLKTTGVTVIPITTTARNGINSKTITVTIAKQGSTNALLNGISLSTPSTITESLGTAKYTTSVSPLLTSVQQIAVTSDPNATIKVNGYKVLSGALSPPIPLNKTGPTNIVTLVTAEDGIHFFYYTLIVTKNGATNTNVTSLTFSPGATLSRVNGTENNYNTSVSADVTSVKQIIVPEDVNTTIKVNGATVLVGEASKPIALNATGPTEVKTVITAQDGVASKTIVVTIRKNGSSNTNVRQTLYTPSSTLTATSSSNYVTSVLPSVTSVQQTIIPEDPNAKLTVNGVAVMPGVPSNPIQLNATGKTLITNVITAPDGVSTKTYTVTITKNGSTDTGIGQIYLTPSALLLPVAGTDNFTASIAAGINTVRQIVIPNDEHAQITVNGTVVASGIATAAITLKTTGKTVITTKIVAQDGVTTKFYTLTITRGSNGELLSPVNTDLAPTPIYVRLTALTPAGTYNSRVTLQSTDADDAFLNLDNCIVKPAPITIATANLIKKYGEELPDEPASEKFTITSGILKNGNTIKTVKISYSPGGSASTMAGYYIGSIMPSAASGENGFISANYDITYIAADIAVKPVKLFVKADDITKDFGLANPPLTITFNGFVNNDGPDQLLTRPAISTTAVTRSTVGQYPITVGGAASLNYLFLYEPGILTVSAEHLLIFVPNTFTPNGDGINDTWNIKNIDAYPNTTVDVFNRSGQKVYSSVGYGTPWDGSYKGARLSTGTYYYFIKNDARVMSGSITLVQ